MKHGETTSAEKCDKSRRFSKMHDAPRMVMSLPDAARVGGMDDAGAGWLGRRRRSV